MIIRLTLFDEEDREKIEAKRKKCTVTTTPAK
jgi:hypothetical protein